MSTGKQSRGLRLKLPATSANLGPGFDAVGLAMSMHLTVEAHPATTFQIHATGRDAESCSSLENNLILDTYSQVCSRHGVEAHALRLAIHNEIPLGMGCGSSAAALLAGILLARHFGGVKLTDTELVAEASRIEGHPDNVAACWHGGFTVSAQSDAGVECATFAGDPAWEMMLALPQASLSTKKARALLPATYSKEDAVFNVQRASLLVAAFAQGRLDLLRTAMQDRIHQPYRKYACPLLKLLLPLSREKETAGVALSGAGPSVLVFLNDGTTLLEAETRLRAAVGKDVELLSLRIAAGATQTLLQSEGNR
jgi:homoserine kinase